MTVFPQHVGAREGRVAAENDFDGGREPAEIVAVALLHQKCGLGEVHLARDVEHPSWVSGLRENTDCRRISGEGFVGERVDLGDAEGHEENLLCSSVRCLVPGAWCLSRVRKRRHALVWFLNISAEPIIAHVVTSFQGDLVP